MEEEELESAFLTPVKRTTFGDFDDLPQTAWKMRESIPIK